MANIIVGHTRLNDVQSALLRAVQNRQLSTHGILMSNNKYYTFHQEHVLNHGSKKYYDVKVTPKDNHFWTGSVLGTLKKFFATMVATVLVIRTRDLVAQELADEQRYDLLATARFLHSKLDKFDTSTQSSLTHLELEPLITKISSGQLDTKFIRLMKAHELNRYLTKIDYLLREIGYDSTTREEVLQCYINHMLEILAHSMEQTFTVKTRDDEGLKNWVMAAENKEDEKEIDDHSIMRENDPLQKMEFNESTHSSEIENEILENEISESVNAEQQKIVVEISPPAESTD